MQGNAKNQTMKERFESAKICLHVEWVKVMQSHHHRYRQQRLQEGDRIRQVDDIGTGPFDQGAQGKQRPEVAGFEARLAIDDVQREAWVTQKFPVSDSVALPGSDGQI